MGDRDGGKPEEYDVVRLLRAFPEHDIPAGATGTVVMDYTKQSDQALPPAYEVEFLDSSGATRALLTVAEADLDVVWRSNPGR